MDTEKIAKDAVDKVEETANDVLEGADKAVSQTRRAVKSAAQKAERAIDEYGHEKNHSIDHLASRAQDWAERSIGVAADSSHRAREQFYRAQERATEYVSDQPGKSMAIAMAAGAALATLVIMATRRRD
ncbi:MAG: hypothetical protein RR749_00570 [Comamonas sp.]|uniref:hypothetical protein n=1 Tax=Comamonas sp. BIGb0152 TaxID=2940601 RepID=UPI002166FDD9|nr:hypothetical protein [Comamonas sp. BIGb0152]MCS4295231.1 ElaB/YqjD/DUF883 family membrane-anchored ribosome-binding protein [Comamonas sp. BIGb0152]